MSDPTKSHQKFTVQDDCHAIVGFDDLAAATAYALDLFGRSRVSKVVSIRTDGVLIGCVIGERGEGKLYKLSAWPEWEPVTHTNTLAGRTPESFQTDAEREACTEGYRAFLRGDCDPPSYTDRDQDLAAAFGYAYAAKVTKARIGTGPRRVMGDPAPADPACGE